MYLQRYSTQSSSNPLTKGRYQHHRTSTKRRKANNNNRPGTSYGTSIIKTQYKDNVYNRPSTRRKMSHQTTTRTVRKTYKQSRFGSSGSSHGTSSESKIKTYGSLKKGSPIKLYDSIMVNSKKKTIQKERSLKKKRKENTNPTFHKQQYSKYHQSSSKPTMKYLGTMLSRINLRRDDINEYKQNGTGTSRSYYTKTRRKTEPNHKSDTYRSGINRNNINRRHDSGKTLKKLSQLNKYASYDRMDINKDLLYHHKTMRKSQSNVRSARATKQKIKATVSSQTNTNTSSSSRRQIKSQKSRSAHMIPHDIIIKKKKKKEIIKIDKNKKNNRSVSDSQINNNNNKTSNIKSLTMNDLAIKSLLGEGAFSKVFLVKFKDTDNVRKNITNKLRKNQHFHQIALKVIPRKKRQKDKDSKNMMWERLVLSKLNHPFIVEYFGSFYDEKRVCILMEFIIGGEILYHFENCKLGRFPPVVSRFYIGEIICALEYVHSAGFIYRDLKPENVLLDHCGHIKLVDFGFAKKLKTDELTYTLCGSKEYVAPEVLVGNGHNKNVDLWSLGVLTFEFIVGVLPFPTQDCNPYEVLDIIKSTKLKFPPFVNKIIANFIQRLLTFNPKKRMGNNGFEEIKNHSWFQEFDWIKCNKKELKPPIAPRYTSEDDVTNFANARFEDDVHDNAVYKDLELF